MRTQPFGALLGSGLKFLYFMLMVHNPIPACWSIKRELSMDGFEWLTKVVLSDLYRKDGDLRPNGEGLYHGAILVLHETGFLIM